MARVEMRYQHEGHAGVHRTCAEELLESFQPAGGSANADDWESGGRSFRCFSENCVGFLCNLPRYHGLPFFSFAMRVYLPRYPAATYENSLFIPCIPLWQWLERRSLRNRSRSALGPMQIQNNLNCFIVNECNARRNYPKTLSLNTSSPVFTVLVQNLDLIC
ncbi:MAG: hypothetical protein Q8O34_11510 [Rhodocyclaceae bacterium]|nr:hypothetical protein [Rhodocyclaceae bacterium]